jgi:hypothetical protein
VLILAGTLFVFIYRQVVLVRRQTGELVKSVVNYERSNAAEFILQMHQKFAEFKKQNPDFTPIYNRYFGTNEPPAAVPGNATNGEAPPKVTSVPSPSKATPAPSTKTH